MQRYCIPHVFFILFISVMRHTTRLLKQHTLNRAARKQHALKGQKQVFATYALKGQQLLAQGSALGNHRRSPVAL